LTTSRPPGRSAPQVGDVLVERSLELRSGLAHAEGQAARRPDEATDLNARVVALVEQRVLDTAERRRHAAGAERLDGAARRDPAVELDPRGRERLRHARALDGADLLAPQVVERREHARRLARDEHLPRRHHLAAEGDLLCARGRLGHAAGGHVAPALQQPGNERGPARGLDDADGQPVQLGEAVEDLAVEAGLALAVEPAERRRAVDGQDQQRAALAQLQLGGRCGGGREQPERRPEQGTNGLALGAGLLLAGRRGLRRLLVP
jgi:hypothetical protein